ncbi:hypothetical protein PORCRE_613 [Porphyromonas crevioricanis JCM 15906]|uniref:Uncharacterized protein n=1 Tax=Porphyromonas crevioricanis JCM 15906 TaxID=1305617 RepID=T1CGQ9_9PORP|nr:hypothetical protein PORCRE_613 [Porphyromonas crevioricanis JCM 15906]
MRLSYFSLLENDFSREEVTLLGSSTCRLEDLFKVLISLTFAWLLPSVWVCG